MDFLWNPAWNTGYADIDIQHRELLRRMELLAWAISHGGERAETERTLLFLGDYVEAHFANEETLMEQSRYPGIVRHRAVHNEMRNQVKAIADSSINGHEPVTMEVMDFLINWLVGHIDTEDRELAAYVRGTRDRPPK